MRCTTCNGATRISRTVEQPGNYVWRTRICLNCNSRIKTIEQPAHRHLDTLPTDTDLERISLLAEELQSYYRRIKKAKRFVG